MLDAFMHARDLFEQLSLLETELALEAPPAPHARLRARTARVRSLASGALAELVQIDLAAEREAARRLLRELAPHLQRAQRGLPVDFA